MDLPAALRLNSELEEHQQIADDTNLFAIDDDALENMPDCY
jgi:hypothetical protein